MTQPADRSLSLTHGRTCIVAAAVLWSLSGLFTRLLRNDTPWTLGPEPMPGLVIACGRVFFGGLWLLPTLRRTDLSFRPMMLAMLAVFTLMNATFVPAMALGKASNAILLQYSAPMWMYLASVWWLGEEADRRGAVSLFVGLAGVATIIAGGWQEAQLGPAVLGLASGFFYAGILLCLRVLRAASSNWLTVWNHLGAALFLLPAALWQGTSLTSPQVGVLAVFGVVQLGFPYWLMARGLRVVSPQEAGILALLEPLLNPLWAFLAAPEAEAPTIYTFAGGACILGALVWRYWPARPSDTARG